MPRLHYLDFSGEINPSNDPDRFHVLWQLDTDRPPARWRASTDDGPSSPDPAWRGIFEGDLVVFSSLLSGAGEFEAVRFVGPRMETIGEEEGVLPLLTAGIEYPEFPTVIVHLAEERGLSLRDMYEAPFDAILRAQPSKMSLFDVFSRDEEAYAEFWEDVPVARRRRPPSGEPWRFSLGQCVWIRTLDEKSMAAQRNEHGLNEDKEL